MLARRVPRRTLNCLIYPQICANDEHATINPACVQRSSTIDPMMARVGQRSATRTDPPIPVHTRKVKLDFKCTLPILKGQPGVWVKPSELHSFKIHNVSRSCGSAALIQDAGY